MHKHKALLNSANTSLNPQFILDTQLSKDKEARMGIPDELTTSYCLKHPDFFPEVNGLAVIEAKVQGTQVSKKRC